MKDESVCTGARNRIPTIHPRFIGVYRVFSVCRSVTSDERDEPSQPVLFTNPVESPFIDGFEVVWEQFDVDSVPTERVVTEASSTPRRHVFLPEGDVDVLRRIADSDAS
ncbi:hypothetical protein NDI76_00560 [Halogeometricum sp. S1BR25-6]|uniref:Uncharacterized protein n=1 Tax=Halogeometricum salsisoli TaxID=2950536 RepID=A0ABU2G9T6_9EURY|nr:hypothetical protein [Halogeometricum sp. S1BR25-6]MDS0297231.1 hypothetical protein [Halogeometricum sp. S1BR25-6]